MHIPFCRQACHYCDFHFSTNLKLKNDLFDCLLKEIILQKGYLKDEPIQSIYLGGGTPSLLSTEQLKRLLASIHDLHDVDPNTEVTIECNPDDIGADLLEAYHEIGINRISLGVQTFDDKALKFLNRVHDSSMAEQSIEMIQQSPIDNFSIDLIYAIPVNGMNQWKADLSKALSFTPPHLSAYCLTIEEKTVFGNWLKNKKMEPIDDDLAADQYEYLMETLMKEGYDHYEISNFALPGNYSRHNINYWKHGKCLGIGPGAHSFDQDQRQFNVLNNPRYIEEIRSGKVPFELMPMDRADRANEYILTSLRTQWGLDREHFQKLYQIDLVAEKDKLLTQLAGDGFIEISDRSIVLTTKGKLLADQISSRLFI